jgi:hypothetical protein
MYFWLPQFYQVWSSSQWAFTQPAFLCGMTDGTHMSAARPNLDKSYLFYTTSDEDDFVMKIVAHDSMKWHQIENLPIFVLYLIVWTCQFQGESKTLKLFALIYSSTIQIFVHTFWATSRYWKCCIQMQNSHKKLKLSSYLHWFIPPLFRYSFTHFEPRPANERFHIDAQFS